MVVVVEGRCRCVQEEFVQQKESQQQPLQLGRGMS